MASQLIPEAATEEKELELDFDKIMKHSLFCLKTINAYPDTPRNLQWVLRFSLMHCIYTILPILLTKTLLFMKDLRNNIIDVCSIASLIVVYGVISFKHFVLIKYRAAFSLIIADIKKYYIIAKTLPKEERKIVQQYALAGRRAILYWVVITVANFIGFVFIPPLLTIANYLKGEPKYVSVVDLAYPKIITSLFSEDTLYWSILVMWAYYAGCSVFMYVGLVPLGPIFILSACAQLDLLKIRVMKIFPADGSVTPEQRTAMLRKIAIELQAIYDFVDNLKVALKLLYELTLKGTALITPVVAYTMIEAIRQGQIRIDFASLFIGALLICSMPCYYGDKLIEKSSELQDAVYMSGWESIYEKATRSTLLIIITRLQRTVAIRTIFVTVCLEALTDVINQAYALFSLLYAALG